MRTRQTRLAEISLFARDSKATSSHQQTLQRPPTMKKRLSKRVVAISTLSYLASRSIADFAGII